MAGARHTFAGLEEAIARYGPTVTRCCVLEVSADTLDYWRLVTSDRAGEVVLAIQRPNGRLVLHTKSFYPSGTYRLPTGGIKAGEDLVVAARRELVEETGLSFIVKHLLAIVHYRFVQGKAEVPFSSFLFLLSADDRVLRPTDTGEQISAFCEVPPSVLPEIAEALEALTVADSERPNVMGTWADWGRFRALPHRLLWELLPHADASRSAPSHAPQGGRG